MGNGFDVDTAALSGLVGDLDETGRALSRNRDKLDATPDAGRSSGEVARALGGLAATVAGLAEHMGTMSDTLRDTVDTYRGADTGVDERFKSVR